MFLCETKNCPIGGVIETAENFTCIYCHRIQNILLYGSDIKQCKKTFDSFSIKSIDTTKPSDGAEFARIYCEKNHFSESIFQEIKEIERTFKCYNSKISFAIATILALKQNSIHVNTFHLAKFFNILHSSLRKCVYFQEPVVTIDVIKGLVEKFAIFFNLDYKSISIVCNRIKSDTFLSSGLNPIITICVFLCNYIVETKNVSIQRGSSIVSDYFKINRNTVLRHAKILKKLSNPC